MKHNSRVEYYPLARERVMSKCKEDKCVNEVDIFYYCDDHFKGESDDVETVSWSSSNPTGER